jgi:hypothetical protein
MRISLERELAKPLRDQLRPIKVDAWIANSLLQKSIRRGDENIAQSAVLTFHASRGAAVWRRLVIIAFEDVGVADPETVEIAVRVGVNRAFRRDIGPDDTVACNLARLLAGSPKSRSAEHLATIAKYHYSLDGHRATGVGYRASPDDALRAADPGLSAPERALAVWRASSLSRQDGRAGAGKIAELLCTFVAAGVPGDFIEATERGFKMVRDPIVPMVCLAWLLADQPQAIVDEALPRWLDLDGLPSYALDKHTWVGRRSIRDFVKYNDAVRNCLDRLVQARSLSDAAYMAAFYADAAPLARKVTWNGADVLRNLAIEADLMRVGVGQESVEPLLQTFSAELDHLNELRARAFFRDRGVADAAGVTLANREANS